MRVFAAIAAIAVSGCLFVGAPYLAAYFTSILFPFMAQHHLLARLIAFGMPFVGVAISVAVAITTSQKGRCTRQDFRL
jgi:hypothetical protein